MKLCSEILSGFILRIQETHLCNILQRIDVAIVIDLEPPRTRDPALSIAGAVQLQKFAVWAISRLLALPGGDNKLLFDAFVEHVRELMGYDQVMVYKFHEDENGELVSESKWAGTIHSAALPSHRPSTVITSLVQVKYGQDDM